MRSILTMLTLTLGAPLVACTVVAGDDGGGDSTLTISNHSSYFLEELHLAPVRSTSWGPDLIAGALSPGGEITVVDILCDTYDVLVVDETGVECELASIDLCFDDQRWVIDDVTLDRCAFTKR